MSEWVPDHERRTVVIAERHHIVGNDHCGTCDDDYPQRCTRWPACQGLIHMEWITKDSFRAICDQCHTEIPCTP